MPTTRPVTRLLYLHGFGSSPNPPKRKPWQQPFSGIDHRCSGGARNCRRRLRLLLNGLTDWPLAAKDSQRPLWGRRWVGFYAAVLARRLRCLAVLVNPAVHPARDLARHLGMPTSWHDAAQTFFAPRFIDELQAMGSGRITAPAHTLTLTLTLTLIAQGDEVLDGREMAAFCTGAQVRLLQGSDHTLSDFDAHLPAILDFLRLA